MGIKSSFISFLCLFILIGISCDSTAVNKENDNVDDTNDNSKYTQHLVVANRTIFYDKKIQPSTAFIVISKKHTDLSVYAPIDGDTILVARYPVCLGKMLGQKEKKGDMKTPECSLEAPFTIMQIQNASDWHHDFGDGRGSIKAYGNWFLRLATPPHSGIGIHGSTNNETSVPGRESEGCIRMLDADIIHLKENYAFKGMKVIIKHEDQDLLDFEKNMKMPEKISENIAGIDEPKPKIEQKIEEKPIAIDKSPSKPATPNKTIHKIKKGETLSGIAKKYNTSVKSICELNRIEEDCMLQIGQELVVK